MTRAQRQIVEAVKAKGYPWVKASWEPIGGCVEMVGREGGWTVQIGQEGDGCEGDDMLYDYVFGLNVVQVMSNVEQLPHWEPV